MDYKQLLFFKRTAELEHMTKAAEELLVSQPFLSRTIADLENELGVKLFDHVGRNIVLNPCGQAFYRRVVKIFNEADDAVKEVRDISQSQKAKLTVVTNVSLYLPGLLKTLAEHNPDSRISQYSARRRKMEKMLINGECDFAICCPPMDDNPKLQSIELLLELGVLIYPKGHRFEGVREVGFEDVQNETLISVARGYGTRDALDSILDEYNLTSKISIETADTSSIFKYVSAGLGIAVVPFSQLLQDEEYKDRYVFFKGNPNGMIALTWRKGQYMTEMHKEFIDKTQAYFHSLDTLVREVIAGN